MITVTKGNNIRVIRDNQIERYQRNGWIVDGEIKAVLQPVKQDTEETPAVEESSEQGEDNEATEEGE